jgi:hypothetical protein
MARDVGRWVAAAVVIGSAAFLVQVRERAWRVQVLRTGVQESQERARARELAEVWRGLERRRRLLAAREALRPVLDSLARAEAPSVAVRFDGPDSLRRAYDSVVQAEVRRSWDSLGLGVTKVSVGVVFQESPASMGGPPVELNGFEGYLFPDSLDRRSCIRLDMIGTHSRSWLQRPEYRSRVLRNLLGPCLYYARFGVPGTRVRSWLARRRHDVAMRPWASTPSGDGMVDNLQDVPWLWVYQLSPTALACSAGRARACRAALRAGDDPDAPVPPWGSAEPEWWRLSSRAFLTDQWFLASVLQQVGPDRFAEFWNTTLPVDSALSLALGEPVDAWLARKGRETHPTLRLGPAVPARSTAWHLVLSALALGVALRVGIRRQVA